MAPDRTPDLIHHPVPMRISLPPTLLLAMTLSSSAAGAAAQASTPAPPAGSVEWDTYQGEGGSRRYRVAVPAGYDPARPAPLLVFLHGCTQDAEDLARGTRMDAAAAEAGAIVVYPEQPAAGHPQKCWTWYDPAHQGRGAGEPAIVAGIARAAMARWKVDPARVYVAGISAGGAMAINAAASYPELFAAAAVHSGMAYRAAAGVLPALGVMKSGRGDPAALAAAAGEALRAGGRTHLPLLVVHGAADAVVSPANAAELAAQWAAAGGLGTPERGTGEAGGRAYGRTAWRTAEGREAVVLVQVEGLGHAWSGGSAEGTYADPAGPDASREILRFLLSHPREAR